MEIFLFWFVFSIIVGVAAGNRGRSGLGWFVLSMIISPLLGLILLMVIPKVPAAAGRSGLGYGAAPTLGTRVKCPDCAELVLREARVCKHCGARLVPQDELPRLDAARTLSGEPLPPLQTKWRTDPAAPDSSGAPGDRS